MAHINLLPWREELRKEQKKQFSILSLLTIVLGGLVVLYAHLYIGGLLDDQSARNEYLKSETAALDQRIKEIKDLETTRAKLQARINIIQQLQRSRPSVVHLFDELARTLPNGVYLTGIAQKDLGVTVTGVAQSNARVSAFMRNVEDSKWIGSPKLDVISSKGQDQQARSNDFTLLVTQVDKDKDEASDSAPGKTAAPAGKAAAPQKKVGVKK
jgi:type IV pilus assembly protein PilN